MCLYYSVMYFNDLENLNDILDTIEPEPEKNILDEENKLELIESMLHIMENYIIDNPTAISDSDFDDIFTEYVKEVIFNQLDFLDFYLELQFNLCLLQSALLHSLEQYEIFRHPLHLISFSVD